VAELVDALGSNPLKEGRHKPLYSKAPVDPKEIQGLK